MVVAKAQIQSYIPQRPPFVMIDNLIEANDDRFESDFCIESGNIFLENGILREFALIENIAQTSTVGLFITNHLSQQEKVDGFIGGISKLTVFDLPREFDTIRTIVKPKAHLGGMYLLSAENFSGEKKLLECDIKLVAVKGKPSGY